MDKFHWFLLLWAILATWCWFHCAGDNYRQYYKGLVAGKAEIRLKVKTVIMNLYPARYRIMSKEFLDE